MYLTDSEPLTALGRIRHIAESTHQGRGAMELKKREFLAGALGAGAGLASGAAWAQAESRAWPAPINSGRQTSTVDMDYKPRRFNKVIELWEDGQPAWYTTVRPDAGPRFL